MAKESPAVVGQEPVQQDANRNPCLQVAWPLFYLAPPSMHRPWPSLLKYYTKDMINMNVLDGTTIFVSSIRVGNVSLN